MNKLVVITQIIINVFEVLAAIVGTIYITKYRTNYLYRYFVYFLWVTVFVEIVFGWLPSLISFFEAFSTLKNTMFVESDWVYSVYEIVSYVFYSFFFVSHIESSTYRKIGNLLLVFYSVFRFSNLIFSEISFGANSYTNMTIGTLMLLIIIFYYYYQLLQSDLILNFYKSFPFYVSVGLLVFYLVLNPIVIYESFYNKKNPEFIEVYRYILTIVNIFMYTCFTIGFMICFRKNKSY